ncbi:MAG: trypsin-like serine protease [Tessaracoccus sp.]
MTDIIGSRLGDLDIPNELTDLLQRIPGITQTELDIESDLTLAPSSDHDDTEPYVPPWATSRETTPIGSFEVEGQSFLEPLVHETPNPMIYPMCTIGIVRVSVNGKPKHRGSGVMVGPNLLLTAGHVAPWGASNWDMEFIPAYRNGNRPFGSAWVRQYRGYNTKNNVTGHDYAICRLYTPIGNVVGWMGARSYGKDSQYEALTYMSSGYPGSYGERPAVELGMRIADIDNDSPGLELEFATRKDLGPGWSGGPLWPGSTQPYVHGVLSGTEKDFLDPRRLVYAAGSPMVDLVRYGRNNWPV